MCGPNLVILSLLHSAINCRRRWNKICHLDAHVATLPCKISDCCRHLFRPVDDEMIAQVISRIEQEKARQAQLSALSSASAAGAEESVTDDSRKPQPMAVDEAVTMTREPVQRPGV